MARIIAMIVLIAASAVGEPSTCIGNDCHIATVLLQTEQGILSHRAAAEAINTHRAAAEETNKHLRNLLESLKNHEEDAIGVGQVIHLVQAIVSSQHVQANISLSDVEDLAEMLDRNNDDKLNFDELKSILYPKFVGKDEPTDDEYPVPGGLLHKDTSVHGNTSFLQDGTGTSGSWQDYSCCGDYSGQRYNEPRYFKPRVEYDGDTYTVKGCYLVSFVFNTGSCWSYFYTNAVGGSSGGMCRCYPYSWDNWKDNGHPDWKWFTSGVGNYIHYKFMR